MAVPAPLGFSARPMPAGQRPYDQRRAKGMENERRNFMRYRMKDSVFAAVNYPTTIVGKIKDMGIGGAACYKLKRGSSETHILDITHYRR